MNTETLDTLNGQARLALQQVSHILDRIAQGDIEGIDIAADGLAGIAARMRATIADHVDGLTVSVVTEAAVAPILPADIARPWNAKYQKRTHDGQDAGGDTCILCGRETSPTDGSRSWVRVGTGGGNIVLPDYDDGPADMGCFPVGSECIRQVPAPYRITGDAARHLDNIPAG